MLLVNLGGNNGVTEYTRNELRAFVGVRSQQGSTRLTNQLLPGQNVTPGELDPLGLNFDMSPTGMMKYTSIFTLLHLKAFHLHLFLS